MTPPMTDNSELTIFQVIATSLVMLLIYIAVMVLWLKL